MSEDKSISVVNLSNLSKPADTLIKKVSNAVGGIFEPYQITRVAKAEAKADLIKAESEIQITDLRRRALHRFVEEEAKRQSNIENIISKALPQLDDKGDPSQIEDDWVTNFFDKCRIVSDDEMQNLWSRVLSGEANVPGTYSKRTVNFLSDLDKDEAKLFSDLCGFGWMIGIFIPLVFDCQADIYNNKEISFNSLSHLDSIGLIQFNTLTGFVTEYLSQKTSISYYGKVLELSFAKETDNKLEVGTVLLTNIGQELAPICGSKPVDGFMDYVKDRWKDHLPEDNIEQASRTRGQGAS
ncbi:MAG: hypothetical protein EMLJLAPB_00750 [Candidatus Argoarchaeum ethanivorans]|uniref:DUF2806 domain-containing protein n=1 Tax=Candidatus Argoarchaeum ethanivorans TaxID=2608793 RepID=A0A811T4W3_9EURY|nr:MAG: hypothetical protein KFBDDELM_00273 [Candidatus Argoarchaeum ethanivorans]CAD6494289.1 MAG: hypothetical protein EMLJLAPB_00750 [Candidatus Argoarchaeum ethanivorans]